MNDQTKEKQILSVQARFRLYDLAKEKWPDSGGDPAKLSERLAKMMLDSGIYLDINSRLVDYTKEEYAVVTETGKSGSKKTNTKWAIIDMGSDEGLVVGNDPGVRGTSDPMLFDSRAEAVKYARQMDFYSGQIPRHEDCFDELVIQWNATHLTFKRSRGEPFSISDADDASIRSASKERTKELTKLIRDIIDIENIGDPESVIPRGMYHSAEEIAQRVETARRAQISRRWAWINENRGIRDQKLNQIQITKGGRAPRESTASTPTRGWSSSRTKWTSSSYPYSSNYWTGRSRPLPRCSVDPTSGGSGKTGSERRRVGPDRRSSPRMT